MVDRQKKLLNIGTHRGPSPHVLCATSSYPNPCATVQVKDISYFFELSNVAKGQKNEKLLSLSEAQENLWCIHAPVAVNLLIYEFIPFCSAK
jgi:hypothetical protein